MKSKPRAKTSYDVQKPHGLRESIASLAVEMASVCGVAPQRHSDASPPPLSNLYMGLNLGQEADLARPLNRFEAMLQASGASARRLNVD